MPNLAIGPSPGAYLIVPVGEARYALPVRQTKEVARQRKITPLPSLRAYVRGLAEFGGRSLPVVDLAAAFGQNSGGADRSCFVVAQAESDAGAGGVALLVDEVESVETFTAHELEAGADRLSSGIAHCHGVNCAVVDVDRLVNEFGFFCPEIPIESL